MHISDTALLAQALDRLRRVNVLLDDTDAGVCLIHLEACIAALETRMAQRTAAEPSDGVTAASEAAHRLGKWAAGGWPG